MKQFKKSKHFYNNKFFSKVDSDFFLIFSIFNLNWSLINALKLSIEDNLGLRVSKIDVNLKVTYIYIEMNFKRYNEDKEYLTEYFSDEDFKFSLAGIYYKGNNVSLAFFENELLQNLIWFDEFSAEILYFNYINILINKIEREKLVFLFYNFIMLHRTILYHNVYNTPVSV